MAYAVLHEEADDLVTCPFCLIEYDDVVESRQPKFLPCSHTLCVQCLKSIKKDCSLICPICRKVCSHYGDVSSLPNNSYAICILRMKKDKKPQAPMMETMVKLVYCLSCETMSDPDCSLNHPTVDVTPNVLSNQGTLLSLNQDLTSLKDPLRSKVANSIMEKKDIQSYLGVVSRALKAAEAEVDRLNEENNTMVAELSSLMEAGLLADSKDNGSNDFQADLIPLLKDCRPEDTLTTVKDKMRRSFQDRAKDIERKVDSCLAHKSNELISQLSKRHLSVKATDLRGINEEVDLNVNWEEGVNSGLMANTKEKILISHLLHSFLERRAGLPDKPSRHPPIDIRVGPSVRVERPIPTSNKFILVVRNEGMKMGHVQFEPSEVHNTAFTLDWAQVRRRRGNFPPPLWNTVDMLAVSESFVTLPMKLTPDLGSKIRFTGCAVPRSPGDVGIFFNTDTTKGKKPAWNLFFTLDKFGGPSTTVKHRKMMQSAALVGRVTQGIGTLHLVSKSTKFERLFYKFTLEAI